MIDDNTIVRSKQRHWRPEARSPIIYTCGVYYVTSSESSINRSTISRSLARSFSRENAPAIIGDYLPTMHVTTSTRIVDELADVNAIWRTTVVYMRNGPRSPCRTSTSIPHITGPHPIPPDFDSNRDRKMLGSIRAVTRRKRRFDPAFCFFSIKSKSNQIYFQILKLTYRPSII